MQKVTTTIIKNGKEAIIYAWVDDKTAQALKQVDEKTRHEYIISEHEIYLNGVKETRRHVSFEECVENGVQFPNYKEDVLDNLIEDEEIKSVRAALSCLSDTQRWLVTEIFYKNRSQTEIAEELGVSKVAINGRLERIFKKMKNFLESDH